MLSTSSLFLVLCAVVCNGAFGTSARDDVGYWAYHSRGLAYPFFRTSPGRVVIFSGSGALSRVSTAPTLKSPWITTTIPPGLRISR